MRRVKSGLPIILHVDMDSFFASIEVRENQELIGMPVVVGADPRDGKGRGVVTTCTYEAREHGIQSGMPISKAYSLLPNAVFLRPNYRLYVDVSRSIMGILRSHCDKFQQRGIDEAYLDVSNKVNNFEVARSLGRRIKKDILEKEGLTCSVGVGPNKLIAKIASDHEKPDGLTIVESSRVQSFLNDLPVRRIPGIGPKAEGSLKKMGIQTVGELSKADVQILAKVFGKWGVLMHMLANGVDKREVSTRKGGPKSIGHERTFHKDSDDAEKILKTLSKLSKYVQRDAEEDGFLFKTITLKVRLDDFSTYTRSRTLDFPTKSLSILKETSERLLGEFLKLNKKIRLLGVRISSLGKAYLRQTTLEEYLRY
jgi:DNA polymerase IV (DinB-like DNA polymerase)